jgi:hypothetical protein
MSKAICDQCQKEFDVDGFQTVNVERDIQKEFFTCPHCAREYLVRYSNAKARTLMEKQAKIFARKGSLLNPGVSQQYERNRKAIKDICDELKERFAED